MARSHGQSNGILSTELLKQRLDIPLLQLSGIFTAQASTIWTRTEARTKTSLLYKQQKYNLLREESEGYSKLEVELLSSMGSPHSSRTAQPAEPYVYKQAPAFGPSILGKSCSYIAALSLAYSLPSQYIGRSKTCRNNP